jgi:AraC-like DNA-binding protein
VDVMALCAESEVCVKGRCAVAEAARATGFADQTHMQRAFKQRYAMTPGSYAPRRRAPG